MNRTTLCALAASFALRVTTAYGQPAREPTVALDAVRVEPVRNIGVVLPVCADPAPFDGPGVVRQLRTELVEDAITRVDAVLAADETPMLARVSFELSSCDATVSAVLVIIDDLATRKNVRRTIDLSDVRGAIRTRALALAVAELLRASFSELALADAPAPAVDVPAAVRDALRTRLRERVRDPVAPRAAPAVAPSVTPRPREFAHRAALALDARSASIGPITVGARLSYELTAARWGRNALALRIDGGASTGVLFDPLGTVQLVSTTAALGALFDSNLPGENLVISLGARVEGGAVWAFPTAAATTTRSLSSTSPLLALYATGALRANVHTHAWMGVELDVGAALVGPVIVAREGATERVIGSTSGAMGAARLAFGARW